MKQLPNIPTDRNFGFTFASVFALLGAWLTWKSHRLGVPALILAGAFVLAALLFSRLLRPLNIVWMRFGELLSRVVNPIVLGVIFFGIFAPVGLLFRLLGRDVLQRSVDATRPSYWNERTPPGPERDNFPRQF